jgi:lipopolysaccharide biosynthesis glycosyltransferase
MEQVAALAPLPPSQAMRRRMDVQRQILARATAEAGRRALFLCTDRNYLCATLVALHSALQHSTPGREDIFVIVDDDDAALADRLVRPFRQRGFTIRVVPATEVVGNAERLLPAYGLFTSGHLLAAAAYYRIFFARHLQALGEYGRAVYIDSDVLVRAPLDGLFASDLRGYPLSARIETPRPEVSRAIALHGLDNDLYFNSGVLLFDLTSIQLTAALDDALAAIRDDSVTLLFHDQCALNLGFRDRFQRLGVVWNQPVGEATPLAAIPGDTAILHFLDRPKPWSTAYEGECATLWFDQWRETAALIGEADAVELFALSSD